MRRPIALLLLLTLLLPNAVAAQSGEPASREPLTLGPGDSIRLQVYKETDMDGEYLVNEDGVVTLPLLGDRNVVGIPVGRLRQQLIADYQTFLRNPAISVTPLRRVSVLGAVEKPGIYSVDPTFSLAEAVALAGGASAEGDTRRVQILRRGQVLREKVSGGEILRDIDIRSGDQIVVQRRGWFARNSTFVVSAIISATGLISSIIIATRG